MSRNMKLQLDIVVSEWMDTIKRAERPQTRFIHTSARSAKSYASSTNSVRERKPFMEGAKLEMQALKRKQELERE